MCAPTNKRLHYLRARIVGGALRQGIAHIPCRLYDAGGPFDVAQGRPEGARTSGQADAQSLARKEKVIASLAQPRIRDWEAAHQFTYPSYPDAAGQPRLLTRN